VSGEEPLQQGEACDAVRQAARQQGFTERQVMAAEKGFDWGELMAACNAMSLFAERKLIELRLPSGKPGTEGGKVLQAYAEQPPPDTVLLVISGKLDKSAQKTKWYQALEAQGVTLQVWPVEARDMPGWIGARLRSRGLQPAPEAVAMVAERVEGNLLAAAQEVEKLLLLFGEGPLSAEQVESAVADSARFDVFGLVDAALVGDVPRVTRMLDGLQGEGVEPILVLWALGREIRSLAEMAAQLEAGVGLERVLGPVWGKRKAPVRAGLQRHNSGRWQQMLRRAGRIDRIIKGVLPGNAWDELLQLGLLMAGVRLFKVAAGQ
jgi:DNA polymerase-3 subunit delta